eukprot:CAMPEP_0118970534 /NCGR_PEP_ID=MMETSP1173-20130426/7413_1 /TAXON_ID=1034831 /ORGANISM="Rhizochromulina marina cf, Strain CCMP1243" /LENGTH=124 /DNA_ID=CAMNT_0006919909 /DNA_START=19 /DNA_END=393 /DNA_ORIENTATION=-
MPLDNDVVDCSQYFDDFWTCVTLGHQVGTYYRTGTLDTCSHNFSNIYFCLRAKSSTTPDQAKAIMRRNIKHKRRTPEPVWELKETPGWDRAHTSPGAPPVPSAVGAGESGLNGVPVTKEQLQER